MKSLITIAALVAAVITVLGSRIVVPALILCFRAIEESFAPAVDAEVIPAALPVAVTEEVKPKARKARRRKPSAATLKAIEAIA